MVYKIINSSVIPEFNWNLGLIDSYLRAND